MANETTRPLKVFLCHASGDKPAVRDLYKRLIAEGVDAWLDQEKLLPGQNWRVEIPRAVREADVVVICLSNKSITKEGYIQKEIKFALDSADEKPEGTIFLIPARLEECPVPEQLGHWQWVDLFEENGFVRLLRSLKLRADRVGATIEPSEYESQDNETERRFDQLYTEGLAAFYTEDWDRAYQRFQTILRERPNHKNAAEKLAQAERQRNLVKLYAQATEAYQSENWLAAIKALEELLEKSEDYKDAVHLLKDAKKQRQLGELYNEAKKLHAAQKWQAVIRVFDQIVGIDPAFPDPDGLLPSAQREATELKRLADLNELYSLAVHKMDAGEWYEARDLLEQVHKAQTGFLDTERLLIKIEDEIIRIEELKRRNNQINTLYEQAHGLIRSKSWRMALEKIDEIQKLDAQFVDSDGIFEKARTELEHEAQVAQRQNELAAMYATAMRLLKEGKYQEALDKWQDLKSIDPKYPDRQGLQITAKRKLKKTPRVAHIETTFWSKGGLSKRWMLAGILIVLLLSSVYYLWGTRTLFFDNFDDATSLSNYMEFSSLPTNGTPEYSFETLDDFSIIRLQSQLSDNQLKAWQIRPVFNIYSAPFRLEVRFNTLRQSRSTSIDGFFVIWLFATEDSNASHQIGLYAFDYGSNRYFQGMTFNFRDNTWYHLVITGTKDQKYRASVYDDLLKQELVSEDLSYNQNLFRSGMKIGIVQIMGAPGGTYPTDVAIDWIKLTRNPRN